MSQIRNGHIGVRVTKAQSLQRRPVPESAFNASTKPTIADKKAHKSFVNNMFSVREKLEDYLEVQ